MNKIISMSLDCVVLLVLFGFIFSVVVLDSAAIKEVTTTKTKLLLGDKKGFDRQAPDGRISDGGNAGLQKDSDLLQGHVGANLHIGKHDSAKDSKQLHDRVVAENVVKQSEDAVKQSENVVRQSEDAVKKSENENFIKKKDAGKIYPTSISPVSKGAAIEESNEKKKNHLGSNSLAEGKVRVDHNNVIHAPKSADQLNEEDKSNDSLKFPKAKKGFEVNDSAVYLLASVVPLKFEELGGPDHLDAVRMEQDGHLNKDYKKEILLGNHEEFEWANENKLLGRLKYIFHRADKNHDGFLQEKELQAWIMLKVQEHLDEATKDNKKVFTHLDANKDGYVTWKEFHIHFLLAKGYSLEKAKQHLDDDEGLPLDPEEKERLIRYKFRWAEADEEPQDNRLTFKELQNFRHPEQSDVMIKRMAKDIIDNLDRDEDNIITEDEFVALPLGEVDQAGFETDMVWQVERRKEFKEVIDLNKDGKVDEDELKKYVDPHNANHAKLEAENLLKLADEDHDEQLSIQEVLDNAELFLGSKMVDTSRNFHDEF